MQHEAEDAGEADAVGNLASFGHSDGLYKGHPACLEDLLRVGVGRSLGKVLREEEVADLVEKAVGGVNSPEGCRAARFDPGLFD